jgi:hypothetical protein
MGVSAWSFLRPRPGELHPLAQHTVEAFFFKGGRIPADAEGFVRYAQVMVSLRDRHAIEVLRVGFFQYRALPDGLLDRKHLDEIMAVVPEAAFGCLRLSKAPQGVIEAQDKFAKRRLEHLSQWKPTKADVGKLRELVNRKAGREIM